MNKSKQATKTIAVALMMFGFTSSFAQIKPPIHRLAICQMYSKIPKYKGKLIFGLTFTESTFNKTLKKSVFSSVYYYVMSVDSIAFNKVKTNLLTYATSNISVNRAQLISDIEGTMNSSGLQNLINIEIVDINGQLGDFKTFHNPSSYGGGGNFNASALSTQGFLNKLNISPFVNNPTGKAMENTSGDGALWPVGKYSMQDIAGPGTHTNLYVQNNTSNSQRWVYITTDDNTKTTTVEVTIHYEDGTVLRDDSVTAPTPDPSTTDANAGADHWTPATGSGSYGDPINIGDQQPNPNDDNSDPAITLSFYMSNNLFKNYVNNYFKALDLKFGGSVDAPDRDLISGNSFPFQTAVGASFLQATLRDINARKNMNGGIFNAEKKDLGSLQYIFDGAKGPIINQTSSMIQVKVNGIIK